MSEVIVDLQHVSKAYGSTTVLKDINIEIEQGKFYTLLGPSGSGKTTICGLLRAFSMSLKAIFCSRASGLMMCLPINAT